MNNVFSKMKSTFPRKRTPRTPASVAGRNVYGSKPIQEPIDPLTNPNPRTRQPESAPQVGPAANNYQAGQFFGAQADEQSQQLQNYVQNYGQNVMTSSMGNSMKPMFGNTMVPRGQVQGDGYDPNAMMPQGQRGLPMMANGGVVPKGGAAVAGEDGAELINVDNNGNATVTPLRQMFSKPPTKNSNSKSKSSSKSQNTNAPFTFQVGTTTVNSPNGNYIPSSSEVVFARGGGNPQQDQVDLQQQLVDMYGQQYLDALTSDPQKAQAAINRVNQNQQQGKDAIQGALGNLDKTRGTVQEGYQNIQGITDQLKREGVSNIGNAQNQLSGVVDTIDKSGAEAVNELSSRADQVNKSIEDSAKSATDRSTNFLESVTDKAFQDAVERGEAEVSSYQNMTAQAVSSERGAVDASFEAAKQPLIAQYGSWANVPPEKKMQVNLAKSTQLGDLTGKVMNHYNDTSASILSTVNSRLSDMSTNFTGLLGQVKATMEQAGLTATTQGKLAGSAQVASLIAQNEQSKGFAVQKVAELQIQAAGMENQFLLSTAQLAIQGEEARQSNLIAIDQLELNGNIAMANYLRNMEESFVPMAPYLAAAVQYASDKQMRDQMTGVA